VLSFRKTLYLVLALALLGWVSTFFARPENLPLFALSVLFLFISLGSLFPRFVPLVFAFILPLFVIEPVYHGGSGFSVAEIGLFGWVIGLLFRRTVLPLNTFHRNNTFNRSARSLDLSFLELALLSFILVVATSCVIVTFATSLYFTPIFFPRLMELLTRVFSNTLQTSEAAWRIFLNIMEFVLLFCIIRTYARNETYARRLIATIFISATVVSCIGIYQYATSWRLIPFWQGQGILGRRINATLPDVNSCGTFLTASLFLGFSLWHTPDSSPRRFSPIMLVAGLLLQTIALLLTFSRIAIFALIINAGLLWYLLSIEKKCPNPEFGKTLLQKGRVLLFSIVIGVILLCSVICILPRERYTHHRSFPAVNHLLKGRLNLWRGALLMWRDSPVFGQGVGQFYRLYPLYWDEDAPAWNPQRENAHNYFLQVASETGLVGIIIFVFLIAAIAGGVFKRIIKPDASSRYRRWYAGILAAIGVFILTSFTGHPLLIRELLYLFAVIIGVGLGYEKSHEDTGRQYYHFFGERLILGILMFLVLVSFPPRLFSAMRAPKPDFFAVGLRPPEYSPEDKKWFFWSGKSAVIYHHYFPDRTVQFLVKNPVGSLLPINVNVAVGNLPAGTLVLDYNDWLVCGYPPITPKRGYVRIELTPDKTWQPCQISPSSMDRRRLGIMLSFIPMHKNNTFTQPRTNEIIYPTTAR